MTWNSKNAAEGNPVATHIETHSDWSDVQPTGAALQGGIEEVVVVVVVVGCSVHGACCVRPQWACVMPNEQHADGPPGPLMQVNPGIFSRQ
jgi:hypothetical protein